jgi:hypothetical protein
MMNPPVATTNTSPTINRRGSRSTAGIQRNRSSMAGASALLALGPLLAALPSTRRQPLPAPGLIADTGVAEAWHSHESEGHVTGADSRWR